MAHTVRFRLDPGAVAELAALRGRLTTGGIGTPSDVPAVTAARAAKLPTAARAALALPSVWLATLGTVAGRPDELVLAAVVDAELLAVHAAVHDALAGRAQGPVAAYLPGAWLPHCVLATERPAAAFAALHPVTPIRARVTGVEISPP
jgi:hypothetical protein